MLKVVQDESVTKDNAAGCSLLDEIARDGARRMVAAALQAEVAAYIEATTPTPAASPQPPDQLP